MVNHNIVCQSLICMQFSYIYLDVLKAGIWKDMQKVEAPHLQELAKDLPNLVMSSKAASTTAKYVRAFNRWKRWASQFPEVQAFPASPLYISLYLNELKKELGSKSSIEAAVYGLNWAHEMAGLDSPTSHPLVHAALEGARRQLGKPTVKKEPVTPEMLWSLVEKFDGRNASLTDLRGLAICVLGYAGFLRYDEIAGLRFSDVKILEEHLDLFIASSKTDKLRNGDSVLIARTGNSTCPVGIIQRYINATKEPSLSNNYLFRSINAKKQALREGKLSYTRIREVVIGMFKGVVTDVSVFGVHSLRSGGATAAANAGVPDRHFKRHGRWKSETAKDGYVKDSLSSRLQVSRNIGL